MDVMHHLVGCFCSLLLPVRFFFLDWGEMTTALGPKENDLNGEGGRKKRRIQMKEMKSNERRGTGRERWVTEGKNAPIARVN